MNGWRRIAVTIPALLCAGAGAAAAAVGVGDGQEVRRCGDLTFAKAGSGVRYQGVVKSNVYELTAVIPGGMTGWGAADGAPFHGFAIFLSDSGCILFEIHLRVDEDQRRLRTSAAQEIRIGNLGGWEEEASGSVDGVSWTNLTASFEFHHHEDHFDDGTVTLVVPTAMRPAGESLYRRFLSDLRLGRGSQARRR